ncbi:hypothetical protein JMJ35_009846 [Cladonia borealis]|uniref:Uncharacterized protein n=1 Tax=Cladonia borealis TaxID=184061 RepID=A0AA39UXZ9_9LECA|nr:hypothetical protein JMJ35_009846 [Cladonia borealis]
MCVIRFRKHKNFECQFITDIERCKVYKQYKQKNPDKVFDFIPTLCMKEFENPTEDLRKQLNGILYTTASSFLIISVHLHRCTHTEGVEMEELAQVCPFCDDEDVQRQLEQLEKKGVSAVKQEMGGKEDEIGRKGKED